MKVFAQILLLGGIVLFWLYRPVFASLVINEFSSGSTSDWVEIYNSGTSSADLNGYRIKDSSTNTKDLSGTLGAGSFISFSFGQSLNNAGDIVNLVFIEGLNENPVDQISYGSAGGLCAPEENQTIGRLPDGWTVIKRFSASSRDGSNNNLGEAPCPTSTPSPTPTFTPTPSHSPTPSPTTPLATSTPTPTKTPTPTNTPTPTSAPFVEEESSESADEESEEMVLGSAVESSGSGGQLRAMASASALIAAGLALLSGVLVWQKRSALRDTLDK